MCVCVALYINVVYTWVAELWFSCFHFRLAIVHYTDNIATQCSHSEQVQNTQFHCTPILNMYGESVETKYAIKQTNTAHGMGRSGGGARAARVVSLSVLLNVYDEIVYVLKNSYVGTILQ